MDPREPYCHPDATWGVLGQTDCPYCRSLRCNPFFAVLLAAMLAGALMVAMHA